MLCLITLISETFIVTSGLLGLYLSAENSCCPAGPFTPSSTIQSNRFQLLPTVTSQKDCSHQTAPQPAVLCLQNIQCMAKACMSTPYIINIIFQCFSLCCSLLETHTGTKQANNLLGEHLHIAVRFHARREETNSANILHSQSNSHFPVIARMCMRV